MVLLYSLHWDATKISMLRSFNYADLHWFDIYLLRRPSGIATINIAVVQGIVKKEVHLLSAGFKIACMCGFVLITFHYLIFMKIRSMIVSSKSPACLPYGLANEDYCIMLFNDIVMLSSTGMLHGH